MNDSRVIPILQLSNRRFVKTKNFNLHSTTYIGDPVNSLRIFNEFEIDEVIVLDIFASRNSEIDFSLLRNIASECFMPLTYGGGIQSSKDAEKLIAIGFEKISFNSMTLRNPQVIKKTVKELGSQSVVCSIDYSFYGGSYRVFDHVSRKFTGISLRDHVLNCVDLGCGEILITNISRESSWLGYDLDGIGQVNGITQIPIIANGGASTSHDISAVHSLSVAAGVSSSVLFLKEGSGVLINYPFTQTNFARSDICE